MSSPLGSSGFPLGNRTDGALRKLNRHLRARCDSRLGRSLGPGALAITFVSLTWWSFGKWADPQIDFGIELYVPWQLTQGKVLYADMSDRNGPLSPYFNAALFQLFGVSLRTLVWANLGLLAVLCGLLYRLFLRACGALTATTVCCFLLSVFGFSQYVAISNYNYITPYQHHQTHGMLLILGIVTAFGEALRRPPLPWVGAAGAALGLLVLTKAELFIAGAGAAAAGLLLLAAGGRADKRGAALALTFCGAALLPVALAVGLLATQMEPSLALKGALGNWSYLDLTVSQEWFYVLGAGLEDVRGNLWLALEQAGLIALAAGVLLAADAWLPLPKRRDLRLLASAAGGALVFAGLSFGPESPDWKQLARALPLTSALAIAGLGATLWSRRGDPGALARIGPLWLLAVAAFGLLGKMLLRARIEHFGFVLAMPATLLLVAGCLELARLRRGAERGVARSLALALVAAAMVFFVAESNRHYRVKHHPVGAGSDVILTEILSVSPRGSILNAAMEKLEALLPKGSTLLVMPEGVSINYWLRRENPTPYHLFLPTLIDAFGGERAILPTLEAHPPDVIALVHRGHKEFGVGPFGTDPRNGKGLMAWVKRDYRRVDRIGAEPFKGRGFGIVLLVRKDSSHGRSDPIVDFVTLPRDGRPQVQPHAGPDAE